MAEFPALPLWTDAYLGDTTHLTTIEHGAYLLLLITMWRNDGRLPKNDGYLARVARLTPAQWARIKPTLWQFFREDGDWVTQGRLTDELDLVRRNSKRQSAKARARWLKPNDDADAAAMPGQSHGNAPTPTPTSTLETDVSNDATASANVLRDPAKAMFDSGLRLLGEAGIRGAKARTLLGRWKRDHGAEAVIVALGRAQRESAVDPVSFCEGVLRFTKRAGQSALPQVGDERHTPDGRLLRYGGALDQWVEVRE